MLAMTSSRDASLRASVLRRPLSHLVASLSQLDTNEVGHTMMVRLAMGLPPSRGWPSVTRVQSRVSPCRVLPRPMSSAKMHPLPSGSRSPATHSNMKATPSRWCGLSHFTSMGSTTTAPLGMTSFAPPSLCCCCTCCSSAWGGGTHSTKGSTPSGSCSAGGGGGAELVEGGWLGIIGGVNGFFWPHGTQYLRANKRLRSSSDMPGPAPGLGETNCWRSTTALCWTDRKREVGALCICSLLSRSALIFCLRSRSSSSLWHSSLASLPGASLPP
mmetsp:Transcript_8332/g.22235  ORF Transcript_8332/g.22235 Transcript_8332/m.22235 type:complete len:272 (+) Transcript_8332:1585-2400(+)